MTTYSLLDGASGRPGVGSSGTTPPGSPTAFSGAYEAGMVFCVSQGGLWLTAYDWWVPNGGQVTAGQKFALWQVDAANTGVLVPNSLATAGTLTAGAMNRIPLAAPLLLAPGDASLGSGFGGTYCAVTGYTSVSGFPKTGSQFGTSQPYAAGITNGPLFGFSSTGGTKPAGGVGRWIPQQPFGTSTADPTAALPITNDADDLLWVSPVVTDVAPAAASYRAFPNMPVLALATAQSVSYTLGLEFSVTQACKLMKIWHYSPPTATVLPTRCGIWTVASQTELAGSDNSAPSWKTASGSAASAGAGWIYCDYSSSGVTLQTGTNYKVSTFANAGASIWFSAQANWWGTGQPFAGGVTAGPLVVPGNSGATPGQDSWNQGSVWTYPNTSTNPEYDGIDVEVQPVVSGSGLLMAAGII